MTASDFAKIANALAWPVVGLFALAIFYRSLLKLLEGLASSLKLKTVKVKAFGVEAELTPQEVKAAVDELLQEISDPTNELREDELLLFERVASSDGRRTVIELEPNFVRGNDIHNRFRRLRDRHLIRPVEGSRWLPEKHPSLTRFGRLVLDLRNRTRGQRAA